MEIEKERLLWAAHTFLLLGPACSSQVREDSFLVTLSVASHLWMNVAAGLSYPELKRVNKKE